MKKTLAKAYDLTLGLVVWLEVPAHRKRLYQVAATVGAVLVAAGFLAPEQMAHALSVLGGVLMLGSSSAAARHTDA